MNEQEAQKAAFEKWDDLNKNSLSIDHKNGHEQGWDDAIEWVKQGQNPVAWLWPKERGLFICATKTERAPEFQFWDKRPTPVYTHPSPPPEVAELVDSAKKALEALEWNWGGEPMPSLEFEAMGLIREALYKLERKQTSAEIQGR